MRRRLSHLSIESAAGQTDLGARATLRCIQAGLVSEPLTENDLAKLRRIRRLRELNINLAGAEISVLMHHPIVALQIGLVDLRSRLDQSLGDPCGPT